MKTVDLQTKGLSQEQIDFVMAANGKDLKKLQQENKRLTNELNQWKQKAVDAERNAQAQIYERDFADVLKVELENVKFTSEAAKRDVIAQIKAAGLKLKDGKILCLTEAIDKIKKADASAFVNEQQQLLEISKARFTRPVKLRNNENL